MPSEPHAVKVGRRLVRIRRSDLEDLLRPVWGLYDTQM